MTSSITTPLLGLARTATAGGSSVNVTVACAVATCDPLPHANPYVTVPGVDSLIVFTPPCSGALPAQPSPARPPVRTQGAPRVAVVILTDWPTRRLTASAVTTASGAATFTVNCCNALRAPLPQVNVYVTEPTTVSVIVAMPLLSSDPPQPSPTLPPDAVHGRTFEVQNTWNGTP